MGHDVGGPVSVPHAARVPPPIVPEEEDDGGPFTVAFQVPDRETADRLMRILEELAREAKIPFAVRATDEPRAKYYGFKHRMRELREGSRVKGQANGTAAASEARRHGR